MFYTVINSIWKVIITFCISLSAFYLTAGDMKEFFIVFLLASVSMILNDIAEHVNKKASVK